MKPIKITISLFLIAIIGLSCSKDDNNNSSNCDLDLIICPIQFGDRPNDEVTIEAVGLNGDCLNITYSASGCDGSSWTVLLIDSSEVMESDPPQRHLRLSLDNNEECDAYITKTKSFDISAIQSNEYNRIILNLDGYSGSILYEY